SPEAGLHREGQGSNDRVIGEAVDARAFDADVGYAGGESPEHRGTETDRPVQASPVGRTRHERRRQYTVGVAEVGSKRQRRLRDAEVPVGVDIEVVVTAQRVLLPGIGDAQRGPDRAEG